MTVTDSILFASMLRYISETNYRHRGNPSDREIWSRFPSWSGKEIAATITELLDLGYITRTGKVGARPTLYAVTETGLSRLRGVTA